MTFAVRHVTPAPDATTDDFKGAMRGLAGGVSVITVGQGRDITGMTVTSVTSLSVDPPTLIVSVNRSSSSWPLLRRYGAFGVNILGADQREIAERFSGTGGLKGADRFNWAGSTVARSTSRSLTTPTARLRPSSSRANLSMMSEFSPKSARSAPCQTSLFKNS